MFAIRCKQCNYFPTVFNDNGCGSIYCRKCNDLKEFKDKQFFNFSSKSGSKRCAIVKWNKYNAKEVSDGN